jgi:hypothetical protein
MRIGTLSLTFSHYVQYASNDNRRANPMAYEHCLSERNSRGNPVESVANALATGVNEFG